MSPKRVRSLAALLIASAALGLADSSNAEGAERQRRWWTHAREILFSDLELSAEQVRGVDAIIADQLAARARFQALGVELRAARQRGDEERIGALGAERRAIQPELEDPSELVEAMRALLTEEQRPTFDMNRARLVAEGQRSAESRRGEGGDPPATGTDGKAE